MQARPDSVADALHTLTERERVRLAGILARLGSPYEAERAAAGLLATAFIARHGLSWSALTGFAARPNLPVPAAAENAAPRQGAARPAAATPACAAPAARGARQERRRGLGRSWQGYDRRRNGASGQGLNLSI